MVKNRQKSVVHVTLQSQRYQRYLLDMYVALTSPNSFRAHAI